MTLRTAITKYPHTAALPSRLGARELAFEPLPNGIIPVFRRMAREACFDVCEFGISTAVCAVELDFPLRVLPVFLTRRFDHRGILVKTDSPLRELSDLRDARIAVRSFTVTDVVWAAGIIMEVGGVLPDEMSWYVGGTEHLEQQKLPSMVVSAAETTPLELLESGSVDAILDPSAAGSHNVRPLVGDVRKAEQEWARRKGYTPPHHTVVIRQETVSEEPHLPCRLFREFVAAKEPFLKRLANGEDVLGEDRSVTGPEHDYGVGATSELLRPDPLPYGLAANRRALGDLLSYLQEMQLIGQGRAAEDYFLTVPEDGRPA